MAEVTADIGGRPPLFESPEKFDEACSEYIRENGTNLTITGLCMWLGFESRQSFYDYEKRDGFSYFVKKARLAVENSYEHGLRSQACTGSIFALKNMGWKDKTETEVTTPSGPLIQLILPKTDG